MGYILPLQLYENSNFDHMVIRNRKIPSVNKTRKVVLDSSYEELKKELKKRQQLSFQQTTNMQENIEKIYSEITGIGKHINYRI